MSQIKISVITATYNQGLYITDCIESVKLSVLAPFDPSLVEHIVINDGSTDDTGAKVKKFDHVHFIDLKQNIGQSAALNLAISKARGQYIFVLDSDDVILQRTLFHCYQALDRSNADWLFTDFIRTDEQLRYILGDDYYGWDFASATEMLKAIFNGELFIQQNTMFRKDLFDQVGAYDAAVRIAQDLDLYIRFLLNQAQPIYLPISSHLHRFHSTNMSQGQGGKHHLQNINALRIKYQTALDSLGI